MTIRNRITLWFTLLVTLLMGISGVIGWLSMRGHLAQHLAREVEGRARKVQEIMDAMVLEHRLHQHPNQPFRSEIPEILTEVITQEGSSTYHGSLIQMTNLDGVVFARTPNLEGENLPILPTGVLQEIVLNERGKSLRVFYISEQILAQGKPVATVQIAVPLDEMDQVLRQMVINNGLELLAVIAIAIFMGQFLSRRALAPMVQMTREVQNMAGHTLEERVDLRVQSPDEIRQLGETFNGLLDRIQEAFVRQEQFVSDASHELRSPLTVIRGHAQLVLKRGQAHPEVFREGLENLIQETGRLERMVTDMLFLARSQATPEPHQPLDMVALIQRTVQELQPLHPQLQLELPAEAIWIEGNSDRLKQVLINLLDNALRAIDPQGQVWVSCHENWSQVEVEVRDNGVGIEPDHLPHLFDRFYRVDTARSRGRGGSGLGLAISHQIIVDHGGKISVESQRQHGSRFVFWLPLLPGDLGQEPDNEKKPGGEPGLRV